MKIVSFVVDDDSDRADIKARALTRGGETQSDSGKQFATVLTNRRVEKVSTD
jgi:hypothetical protein